MGKLAGILIGFLFVFNAFSVTPNEVLLLVNKQSQPSLKVANAYMNKRAIPPSNVVYLDIPESIYGGTATITPEQFTTLIWEPVNAVVQERGIEGQILSWIYSVDFPIRVKTSASDRKQMSVIGLTFLRNQVPDLESVEKGTYHSKLFAGPSQSSTLSLTSLSFGTQHDGVGELLKLPEEAAYLQKGLGDEMPLPSMMLGYIGEKGNDVDTVLATIDRGFASDYRGQHSGIYFVMNDDVRSTCRDWQFYPAVQALKGRGVSATVTNEFPSAKTHVMGVMMGVENVDPSQIGSFADGAVAEHLTSWGAEFQKRQTKVTDWLEAGATGTAGTVVEPYAIPNKFPSARFYEHYVSGCSMLESFYQSIACPLQILLLGDPLAQPYAMETVSRLLGANELSGAFTYIAQGGSKLPNTEMLYAFYIDGKEVKSFSVEPSFYLRADTLSDGYHEMRMVTCTHNTIRFYAFSDKAITINRKGRAVAFSPEIEDLEDHKHALKVTLEGGDLPKTLRLINGERVLDEQPYGPAAKLVLDEKVVGEGSVRIQAEAVFADGMIVRSSPALVNVVFAP